MRKTYTKIILGAITFFGALLGPYSIVIQPMAQQAGASNSQSLGFVDIVAYAGGDASNVTPTDSDLAVTLESFLKVVYVILWPALFIAGLAMDNSLVYGEIFGLDNALFKFWQIMKNFANFALGFIFVFSILKYIFDIKGGKATNPKDIIVKLLLGAIGVNASWFVIGALVDLSTVLTVGVGGLPLQLIGDNAVADKPIFGSVTSIKLNDQIGQKGDVAILHTWPGANFGGTKKYLLPCYIEDGKVTWGDKRQGAFGVSNGNGSITGTNIGRNQVVDNYCVARGNGVSQDIYTQQGSPSVSDVAAMKNIYTGSLAALQNAGGCGSSNACQTLKSFTKKTESYQGAFYSLYASLLNLSTIHIGVPKSNVSLGMEMLIKFVIALAYLIPLLILAVILIMRVGYLWLIIAFSPFIVLASIKNVGDGMKGKITDATLKKVFDIKNVISLLLLPVIVTFTISLSIVFLSSLSEGLTKTGTADSMGIYQRTEGSYKCYDVAITSICLDMPGRDIGTGIFDYFSWMIMNLFGVGLMWFAVMAALKSSEFTSKVAGTIETLGKDMISSANVIPIPGGATTSIGAIKELPRNIENQLGNSKAQGSQILSQTMAGVGNNLLGKDKKVIESINTTTKAITDLDTNPKLAPNDLFVAKQKTLVDGINNGNFKAAGNMSFGQADNSLAFANMLASQVGSKHTFKNGQELFTTQEGQKILGTWFDNTNVDWGKVKEMYGNGIKATDWDIQETNIKNNIKGGTLPKEEVTFTGKVTPQKFYRRGNDLLIGEDETRDIALSETKELETIKTDINTLLKDEKYKDIEVSGVFALLGKRYTLKKENNQVTQVEVTPPPPAENKDKKPSENTTKKPEDKKTTPSSVAKKDDTKPTNNNSTKS